MESNLHIVFGFILIIFIYNKSYIYDCIQSNKLFMVDIVSNLYLDKEDDHLFQVRSEIEDLHTNI